MCLQVRAWPGQMPLLADINKPSPEELKHAIRLLKNGGLPSVEVQYLTNLFKLGPPPPPPPLTAYARFDKMELVRFTRL